MVVFTRSVRTSLSFNLGIQQELPEKQFVGEYNERFGAVLSYLLVE